MAAEQTALQEDLERIEFRLKADRVRAIGEARNGFEMERIEASRRFDLEIAQIELRFAERLSAEITHIVGEVVTTSDG